MNGLIRSAISFPIAVGAVVLAMVIFGVASLRTIPIQLTPDIDRPILQVRVNWPGASPQDVERDIVLRLERELSSLSGVQSIESTSRRGSARVTPDLRGRHRHGQCPGETIGAIIAGV